MRLPPRLSAGLSEPLRGDYGDGTVRCHEEQREGDSHRDVVLEGDKIVEEGEEAREDGDAARVHKIRKHPVEALHDEAR